MPLEYTKNIYDTFYDIGINRERVHYERRLLEQNEFLSRGKFQQMPDFVQNTESIVVVGCGFGWTMEAMREAGIETVVGIDPSPYIHEYKHEHASDDTIIVDGTVGFEDIAAKLNSLGLPTSYDVVLTENCASSHSDDELDSFLDGCEELLSSENVSNICHIVTALRGRRGDTALNWKTIDEWSQVRTSHTWLDPRRTV